VCEPYNTVVDLPLTRVEALRNVHKIAEKVKRRRTTTRQVILSYRRRRQKSIQSVAADPTHQRRHGAVDPWVAAYNNAYLQCSRAVTRLVHGRVTMGSAKSSNALSTQLLHTKRYRPVIDWPVLLDWHNLIWEQKCQRYWKGQSVYSVM